MPITLDLLKYISPSTLSIMEAMKKIDRNSVGLIYIVDNNHLLGCLTDGDIRRWILKTGGTDGKVSDAMNPNPKYLFEDDRDKAIPFMEKEQLHSLAIVDRQHVIVDVVFHQRNYNQLFVEKRAGLENTPVIIMAGGKGSRLYPYTKILPKPLIPVGEVPILERIFRQFYRYGVQEFFLTVNYRKEIIKSYFADVETPYQIHYVEEEKPLGTAGSIRLIDVKFDQPVVVTNCDILIEADYEKILSYHKDSGNAITIVSSLKNMAIPYGVLHSGEKGIVTSMEEKPEMSYFINTGMYVVEPKYLEWIPKDEVFHMTDLVNKIMEAGEQVGMFPISENSFLDMGQFEEMKKMEERLNHSYAE